MRPAPVILPGSLAVKGSVHGEHVSACAAAPAHHWIIQPPNGKYASGYCKHCGLERGDFRNAADDGLEGVFGSTWRER